MTSDLDIEIKNTGAIEYLRIVAPPGKVTCLYGPNGSGKTTALNIASQIAGGKKVGVNVTKRDGTLRGSVTAGEVTLKVTASGTGKPSGELDMQLVDDNLTLADIVDPGIKDLKAADRTRIEAVCSILHLDPDVELFRDAIEQSGMSLEDVASDKANCADSVVLMARQLKADAEAAARKMEADADYVIKNVAGIRASSEAVDVTQESNSDSLDEVVEESQARLAELKARRTVAQEARDTIGNWTAADGDSLAVAVEAAISHEEEEAATLGAARAETVSLVERLEKLKKLVEAARANERDTESKLNLARSRRSEAAANLEAYEASKALVAVAASMPTQDDMAEASERLNAAKAARDNGVLIRLALANLETIKAADKEADGLLSSAEKVRASGKAVMASLADLLEGTGMSVNEDGRIVVDHPVRGETYYSELSHGERWQVAIQIAVASVERRGLDDSLLVIPQEAWEGLDATGQRTVCESVDGTPLRILVAKASGERTDPIRCETLAVTGAPESAN